MLVAVNFWAVLVAAVAAMVLGSLWYSPFGFGKLWMRLRGADMSEMGGKFPADKFALQFVAALLTAFFIAEFAAWLGVISVVGGLVVGLWLWLGFVTTTMLGGVLWDKMPWSVYVLNIVEMLLSFLLMGAIIGVWR